MQSKDPYHNHHTERPDETSEEARKAAYKKRILRVVIPSGVILLFCLLYLFVEMVFKPSTACWFYTITSKSCPGCGGTRMIMSLLQGHIYQAFRYNPGLFVLMPVIAFVYIQQSVFYIRRGYTAFWLDRFFVGLTIALLLYGIIRNIGPFTVLAPTIVR